MPRRLQYVRRSEVLSTCHRRRHRVLRPGTDPAVAEELPGRPVVVGVLLDEPLSVVVGEPHDVDRVVRAMPPALRIIVMVALLDPYDLAGKLRIERFSTVCALFGGRETLLFPGTGAE